MERAAREGERREGHAVACEGVECGGDGCEGRHELRDGEAVDRVRDDVEDLRGLGNGDYRRGPVVGRWRQREEPPVCGVRCREYECAVHVEVHVVGGEEDEVGEVVVDEHDGLEGRRDVDGGRGVCGGGVGSFHRRADLWAAEVNEGNRTTWTMMSLAGVLWVPDLPGPMSSDA